MPELLSADVEQPGMPDRRLELMFACAHPAIEESVRAPLILQTVLGFDAAGIAGAWLTSPEAMGKRLVRAKAKIREAGIPFRVPEKTELGGRLRSVLDAIYAVYTEGWSRKRELAEEALFLARLVVDLLPGEGEALGLMALLRHSHARRFARLVEGEYVPLEEQDTTLWRTGEIAEAEQRLQEAAALKAPGRYQLEAALQSAHVHRRLTGRDNWADIRLLYEALYEITGSPVVRVNAALAVAQVEGATTALAELPTVGDDPRLAQYQPYWAVRAELLSRVNAAAEAAECYQVAIGLEEDEAVRRFLRRRLAAVESRSNNGRG